ncbi:hypothetical protein [Marinifilum sp.]|uniref:restriction endonuclease subunit S n=1 Tax=Marinifilum sp. TaxID=2033137 RepID=UPI003BACC023
MEGLEIKEKDFSAAIENKDFRIDSQFYTKEPIKNPVLKYDKIGNHLIRAQYGISISMNEDGVGYPIYRMNEIHNMMCDTDVSKSADISKIELETFVLNDRDVLFNRTNSFEWVGRTGLYKKTNTKDFVFASYLVRFIPNQETLLPEYLTTFLNSKYGVWDIKRRARQSINQTNVNPEEVKEIEFPLLSQSFQKLLKCCFDNAHSTNILSQSKYQQAENLLLETLGLKGFEPSKEPVNIKSFNESFGSSGRLDAEYYQKKYDDFLCKLNDSSKLGFNILKYKDIASGFKYGSSTKLNYQENGVPFLRIADLNDKKFELQNLKFISKEDAINEKGASVSVNDILISRSGTLGLTVRIPKFLEGAIFGSYFIKSHLKVNINPTYITLYLNSLPGTIQIEQANTGGIQTNITIPVIENILIALPSIDFQNKIELMISESDSLKKESEQLLNLAKTAVEKAIEENEEKAINYISEKLAELKINLSNEG